MIDISQWVLLSILASIFQVIRNAFSKSLKEHFSDLDITAIRFIFGLPFILIIFITLNPKTTLSWLTYNTFIYVSTGACFQILGTYFLLQCFKFKSFAIGITFSKLEAVFAAGIGIIVFAEAIKIEGLFFILLSLIGLLLIFTKSIKKFSLTDKKQLKCSFDGLLCGLFFATSSVFFRHANLNIASIDSPILKGVNTLLIAIIVQSIIVTIYLIIKKKSIFFSQNKKSFPKSIGVGFFGIAASCCWFTAFTEANAAYVKTVGQIEVLFSIAVSLIVFKEKITKKEFFAMMIICYCVLGLNTL